MRRRRWTLSLLVVALIAMLAATWYGQTPKIKPARRDATGLLHDPIEDDPAAQPALRAAEREAKESLKDVPPMLLGRCHDYWAAKKSILKHKYGIDWRTPAELNPGVAFD